MKVAIQGARGAYSEEAARSHFGPAIEVVMCEQFAHIFEAVVAGRADRGVVPVENSEAGTVAGSYPLFLAYPVFVIGEIELRVRHCLLGLPGSNLERIRRAHSHPQALMQCEAFLRARHIEAVAAYDTAGSAAWLAEKRPADEAAIASRLAGSLYGLEVLAEGIETNPNNTTRFLVIGLEPAGRTAVAKTSLVFATRNEPGALYRALGTFARRGVNLTKLESTPSRRVAWEYWFYVDVEGHQEDPALADALQELRADVETVRVLGSYPRAAKQ